MNYVLLCYVVYLAFALFASTVNAEIYAVFLTAMSAATLFVVFADRQRRKSPLTVFLAICICLSAVSVARVESVRETAETYFQSDVKAVGRVKDIKENVLHVKVREMTCKKHKLKTDMTVRLHLKANEKVPDYGDIVTFTGDITCVPRPDNFGEFQQDKYLLSMGILGDCKKYTGINVSDGGFYPLAVFPKIRNYSEKCIRENIGSDAGSFVCGILLGDKSSFTAEMMENIRSAGISHVTAVSGMHVSILITALLAFANLFSRRRKHKAIIVTVLLAAYCVLTGLSPSVIRATVMAACGFIGVFRGRTPNRPMLICLAASVMLFISPFLYFNPSFVLSFLATMGLALFLPVTGAINKKGNPVTETVITTLVANLCTFPYVLATFGECSIVGLLANLLIIPLVPFIFIGGMLTALTGFIPCVPAVLGKITGGIAHIVIKIASFSANVPMSKLNGFARNGFFVAAYVLAVILLYVLLQKKINKKYSDKTLMICYTLIVAFIVGGVAFNGLSVRDFTYTQISAGNADAALINVPGGTKVLVDTGYGTVSGYSPTVVTALENLGTDNINAVFITNFEEEHCGALENVLKEFSPYTVYVSENAVRSGKASAAQKLAKKYGAKCVGLKTGDVVSFGKGKKQTEFSVISPAANRETDEERDTSLCLCVKYSGRKILMMSDISQRIECEAANKAGECDVLKVADHGKSTSTKRKFAKTVKPKYSIITCKSGEDALKQVAAAESALQKERSVVLCTGDVGAVKIRINSKGKIDCNTVIDYGEQKTKRKRSKNDEN